MAALAIVLLVCGAAAWAAPKKYTVKGEIYDRVTTKSLPHTMVAVLNPDSTVQKEVDAYEFNWDFSTGQVLKKEMGKFEIPAEVSEGALTLRLAHEGYDTAYIPLDFSGMGGRQHILELPPLYMSPESGQRHELGELVVKTSKVKFYNKGDTIVYNADAFMLPEGSMLDALIAQMPGVEIKDGGEIYVNGKYVESLLLNGKDFFKGNTQALRENIGAYMVEDIAVYDKYGEMSTLMDQQVESDKEYVMDVRIKKDYMGGFSGNLQAGYGTGGKYMGKLFAMYFTNNSRFAVYANRNNVNDTEKPNDGSGYSFYGSSNGRQTATRAGFDYGVSDPFKVWDVDGNVNVTMTDNDLATRVFTESYLAAGNTYQTSLTDDNRKNLYLSTNHNFKYRKNKYYTNIRPSFLFTRSRSRSDQASALFNADVQEAYDIDREVIDALYSGSPSLLRKALVNRNRYYSRMASNSYSFKLWSEQTFKFSGSSDALSVWIEGKYDREHSTTDMSQSIDYGCNDNDRPVESFAQRRHTGNAPAYDAFAKGAARYFLNLRKWTFTLGYEFRHDQARKTNEQLAIEATLYDGEASLSDDDPLMPDYLNSNKSMLYTNTNMFKTSIDFATDLNDSYKFKYTFTPEFRIVHRRLNYNAYEPVGGSPAPVFIPVSRTSHTLNNARMQFETYSNDGKKRYMLLFWCDPRYVQMTDLIDIPNTTDPLNIYRGNPNLKDGYDLQTSFSVSATVAKNTRVGGYADFGYTTNDVVKGYTYDSSTGVREYRSENVSGNLYFAASSSINTTFGPADHQVSLDFYPHYGFTRTTLLIGEDGPAVPQHVYINSANMYFASGYEYRQKYKLTLSFNGHRQFSRGTVAGANNITSSYTPGAKLLLKLPGNLTFNTDFSYRMTRGSASKEMNLDIPLLNASLQYDLKNAWTFKASGYDILGKQRSYTSSQSPGGRVETIRNTLPRYFMLTVGYKFNTRKNKK